MTTLSLLESAGYQLDAASNIWLKPCYSSIAYSDGDEIEERLARIICHATDLSVFSTELSQQSTDWPSLYHLSASRANILRPLESVLVNADVLEVGAGCGAITRYLGETCANVVALEGSLRRASIARSRTRDLDDVNVVADRFNEFACEHKFDVVTLIGVLEYANMFTLGTSPAKAMLERVRTFLKPGGKVIIAIENQLGLKYFAGAPEDHLGQPMYGIEGRYREDQPQTFGRQALKNILTQSGFSHSNFMAPFPDYKLPASIVTEAGFADPKFDASSLAWQSARRDPQLPPLLSFSPELAWPVIFDNELALDLANSFLVIASCVEPPVVTSKVLACHYSTDRRPQYCKETSFIRKGNDDIKVVCRLLSSTSIAQDDALTLFRPEAESDYVLGTPLSREFIEIVSRDGWRFDDVVGYYKRYLDIIFRLTNSAGEQIVVDAHERTGYVRGRFIDAIPQNIICMPQGMFRLIDTEWQGITDAPIARLLFRSILFQMSGLTRFGQPAESVQPLTRWKFIVEIFSRLGLKEKVADFSEFLTSESIFQEMVTGRSAEQFMAWWPDLALTTENLSLAVPRLNQAIAERDGQINGLNRAVAERDGQINGLSHAVHDKEIHIGNLTSTIAQRDAVIDALYGSSSWRISMPLRFIAHQAKRAKRVAELAPQAITRGGGLKNTLIKANRLYQREGIAGIKRGFKFVAMASQIAPSVGSDVFDRNDYAEWVRRYDTLTVDTRVVMRNRVNGFKNKPLISVVMPTYNTQTQWLNEAIESVRNQIYPYWELCIADDASTDKAVKALLERYVKVDPRIKVVFREKNGHISAASNSALALVSGQWVALLDHDDLLTEHALFWVADAINSHPEAGLIYSDEDKLDSTGRRFDPYFKCELNPELLLAQNMVCHLGAYRFDLLKTLNGFRTGFEGAQDYDLALRVVEQLSIKQIIHIPRVLYHWRAIPGSTALAAEEKNYAADAGRLAVAEHLKRRGLAAEVTSAPEAPALNRVRFALPDPLPVVSVIIPTRDHVDLLSTCIHSIFKLTTYPSFEIVIIDNGSVEPATADFFASLPSDRVKVLRDDPPFNFSALNNHGAQAARGDLLCLMNNDIEILTPDWLEEMVSFAVQPEVGCVGARLWYPDGRLQHGGVVVGLGGVAGHSHKYVPKGFPGYFRRAVLHQSFSAVTAACLLVRRTVFDAVNGLDERLAVAFNDVDFCLRVQVAGYRNVWTPYAEMTHHESVSRGHENTPEKQDRFASEVQKMKERWGAKLLDDPCYSPNLTLDHEDFSLAWPPRIEFLA